MLSPETIVRTVFSEENVVTTERKCGSILSLEWTSSSDIQYTWKEISFSFWFGLINYLHRKKGDEMKREGTKRNDKGGNVSSQECGELRSGASLWRRQRGWGPVVSNT